jgi:hypothetical protein
MKNNKDYETFSTSLSYKEVEKFLCIFLKYWWRVSDLLCFDH